MVLKSPSEAVVEASMNFSDSSISPKVHFVAGNA
jgi:hypothetical protein